MSSDVRQLYQEVLLDHGKRPRNLRRPERIDRKVEGHNPLCGDSLTLYLTLDNGVIADASFEGKGCTISTASASMMTESVRGRTVEQAGELQGRFHAMLTGEDGPGLGKLDVFSGVRDYPVRVKCATLAWHALKSALENEESSVSTE
jgi:nitrogen fixation NifU-like protein